MMMNVTELAPVIGECVWIESAGGIELIVTRTGDDTWVMTRYMPSGPVDLPMGASTDVVVNRIVERA